MAGGEDTTGQERGASTGRTSRRDALKIAAIIGLPLVGFGALLRSAGPAELAAKNVSPGFVEALCNLVLPATDTPGAAQAGVAEFLPTAFRHGLFGGDVLTLGKFEALLDAKVPKSTFLALDDLARLDLLAGLDAATFSRPGPPNPDAPLEQKLWRAVKGGIVQSYYTSEIGGSQELKFELIPGDTYRADVAVSAVPYLSNYWMENVF